MMGTTNFRKRYRRVKERALVGLVLIEGDWGSVHLATTDARSPDGENWQAAVMDGVISNSTRLFDPTAPLGEATFSVDARVPLSEVGAQTMPQALATHNFIGAAVTIYIMPDGVTSMTDVLRRFVGRVSSYSSDLTEVEFSCVVDRSFNNPVTSRTVGRSEFPGAQEDAVGASLGIAYGRAEGLPYRREVSATAAGVGVVTGEFGTLQHVREFINGSSRAGPALLVDVGRGDGIPARVSVAGHKVKQIGTNNPYGTAFWLAASGGGPAHKVDPPNGDIFNAALGAGFNLDDLQVAHCPASPVVVEALSDTGLHMLALIAPQNEWDYALIDTAAGHKRVRARMTNLPNLGKVTNVRAYVIYRAFGASADLRFTVINGASSQSTIMGNDPLDTYDFMDLAGGVLPSAEWQFGEHRLEVVFTGGSPTGYVEVVQMGLDISYIPTQEVFSTFREWVKVKTYGRTSLGTYRTGFGPFGHTHNAHYIWKDVVTETYEFRGKFFANLHGHLDDAIGTYTGTADAVIERPADVVRHILATYGGASCMMTPRAMGSFVDARPLMRTWNNRSMRVGFLTNSNETVQSMVESIARGCPALVYPSEFDGLWRYRPWKTYPAAGERIVLNSAPATSGSDLVDFAGASDAVKEQIKRLQPGDIIESGDGVFTDGCVIDSIGTGAFEYRLNLSVNASATRDVTLVVLVKTKSYADDFHARDLLDERSGCSIDSIPEGSVLSGVSMPYAYDSVRSQFTQSTEVSRDASKGGYSCFNLRDESITVDGELHELTGGIVVSVGQNFVDYSTASAGEKAILATFVGGEVYVAGTNFPLYCYVVSYNPGTFILTLSANSISNGISNETFQTSTNGFLMFAISGTERFARLDPGEYTPAEVCVDLSASMEAGVSMEACVVYAGLTISGHNDKLDVVENGVTRVATVPAGQAFSMEHHAAKCQRALNTIAGGVGGWSVTYSRTTKRFTVARSGGTNTVLVGSSANRPTSGWQTLGFDQNQGNVSASGGVTGARQVEEGWFGINQHDPATLELWWWRGRFGTRLNQRQRGMHETLGFVPADCLGRGAGRGTYFGDSYKGTREHGIRATSNQFLHKSPTEIDGRVVNDSPTAREARNRVLDLGGLRQRLVARLSSNVHADAEVGDTFQFAYDMVEVQPYPLPAAGGFWNNRTNMILEAHTHFGTSWHTELVVVDVDV